MEEKYSHEILNITSIWTGTRLGKIFMCKDILLEIVRGSLNSCRIII